MGRTEIPPVLHYVLGDGWVAAVRRRPGDTGAPTPYLTDLDVEGRSWNLWNTHTNTILMNKYHILLQTRKECDLISLYFFICNLMAIIILSLRQISLKILIHQIEKWKYSCSIFLWNVSIDAQLNLHHSLEGDTSIGRHFIKYWWIRRSSLASLDSFFFFFKIWIDFFLMWWSVKWWQSGKLSWSWIEIWKKYWSTLKDRNIRTNFIIIPAFLNCCQFVHVQQNYLSTRQKWTKVS